MKVFAKCHNYAGCLLAYRGEEIELPQGGSMVCPECGKPLSPSKSGGTKKLIPWIAFAAILVIGGLVALPMMSKAKKTDKTVDPGQTVPVTPNPNSGTASNPSQNTNTNEPPQTVTAPTKIDLDVEKAENVKVKKEVLTRIDLMPNISQANKDKLYNSVERARSMGKVLTIPFPSGKITVGAAEVQAMKTELEKLEIAKLRDDPTAVFVILGYADPKGDEKKNIAISQARADAVLEALRDKAGVSNVMHAVAMGGSTIVDEKNLEKNRIVEIWAVLP